MPLFNVMFVAVDTSSTDIKITQPALYKNGHSSVVHVR